MLLTSGQEADHVGYLKPTVASTIIVDTVTSPKLSRMKGDLYEN